MASSALRRLVHFNSRPSARGDRTLTAGSAGGGISIHAPPRGATTRRSAALRPPFISIHAPPRGATRSQAGQPRVAPFQFTPLREGRPSRADLSADGVLFQFTPLREGRPLRLPSLPTFTPFQFTPLREGRRRYRAASYSARKISIHAPPRGATHDGVRHRQRPRFQFTPLREGRRQRCRCSWFFPPISIHAPPRGATCWWCASVTIGIDFNSRPSARGDCVAR